MAYILNIETATHICSVSLSKNGETIAIKESNEDKTHAELLTVFIEEILKENKIKSSSLTAIAVSEGPGSYTGLRIGVSVAKGLCYGLKIPLISVSTLEAMANGAKEKIDKDTLLCPMIDARRMEVYTALFNNKLEIMDEVHPKIIDEDSFNSILSKQSIFFFGTGANKCQTTITHENAIFSENLFTSSEYMASLSYSKYKNNEFEDVAYFEPFYLKEFQAIKSTKKYF